MVERVWSSPDIYRIEVVLPNNPLRSLNVYVVCTPGRNLVIDTGFHHPVCHDALWAGIHELELDLSNTVLFLTHVHSDHIGLVWDFVERDVPVYTGRIDHNYCSVIQDGSFWPAMDACYLREGYPLGGMALQADGNHARIYAPPEIYPATLLEDGELLTLGDLKFQAIHTPGHTPGHMVLYLPQEQLLFSGDHILFDITPNIGVWVGVPDPLADYLESLEKIRPLPIRQVFPAHRGQKGDVYQRIDALKEHHRHRLEEIAGAVRDFPGSTAYELAGHISWSARGLGWEQFPPNQKWFAVSETLAHLYYMQARGQVARRASGGVYVYHPV